jgi:hypothetical protein
VCRPLFEKLSVSRRTSAGRGVHQLAVIGPQSGNLGLAQKTRLFEHCAKIRGKVSRQRIDDPEHFGGRCLLRQGFVAFGKCLVEPPLQLSVGALEIGNDLLRIV